MHTRVHNLTWTHLRIIMREATPEGRQWYMNIERDTNGLLDERKCKRMEKVSIRFYNDHELVSATTQLKLRAADGKRYNTDMLNANGVILLKFISGQLRRELLGLRGFSENNLKNMRKFYEVWKMLDKTTIAIVESLNTGKHIDIQHLMTCQSTCARLFPICRR